MCARTFKNKYIKTDHKRTFHGSTIKIFLCPDSKCGYGNCAVANIKSHYKNQHKNNSEPRQIEYVIRDNPIEGKSTKI